MIEPAMTVRQVAEYLNVASKVIYRLVQAGDLPGFKVAGTWRFKRGDIDAWIEMQKQRSLPETRRQATASGVHPSKPDLLDTKPALNQRGENV